MKLMGPVFSQQPASPGLSADVTTYEHRASHFTAFRDHTVFNFKSYTVGFHRDQYPLIEYFGFSFEVIPFIKSERVNCGESSNLAISPVLLDDLKSMGCIATRYGF